MLGRRILALAREHRATVLHCHQYSPFVYGSIAGLLAPHLRIVYTEHGRVTDAPPSRKRAFVNRALGRRPNRVVAVSHELRAFMVAEGFRASHVEVIHNGIDAGPAVEPGARERARQGLGHAPTGMVIGSVARFDPIKRFDVLVREPASCSSGTARSARGSRRWSTNAACARRRCSRDCGPTPAP